MTDVTNSEPTALAALVASRLCHDLIGPIGAIGNGLELLQSTMLPSPELELIGGSASTATARIRFFRVAFGAASDTEILEARALADMLGGMFGGGRINIQWLPEPLTRREARLLCLLLLCAESALPVGGTLVVDRDHSVLRLVAEGRRIRFDHEPWAHLVDGRPLESCSSAQVHFLLARHYAEAEGRRITLAEAEGGFVLVLEGG
ncbi:MAG TPA: histidine phosphotransferase family protein [Paracoccaceae bacterium]|nr:histidine phosphotransferase family protein [Paracoccaceae bacterium]